MGMLPTPTAFDYNTPRSQEAWDKAKEKHGDALQNPLKQMAAFGMLPTPTTKNVSGGAVQVNKNGKRENKGGTEFSAQLHDLAKSENSTGTTSWARFPTVPLFVEEMMGLPKELDGITFSKWRRESIKAYGNAIVPQVALQIFKAINEYENGT